jgi:hypothetical protein
MADWNKPALSDTYSNFLSYLNDKIKDAGYFNSPDVTTIINPYTGMKRWNVANDQFEIYNGTTWVALTSTRQKISEKDATGGYVGLTLFKINFKNAANNFTSFFTNANTAARTYTFQDKDGTIAHTSDMHDAAAKSALVDADELVLSDSAASFVLKKFTFANLKTVLAAACSAGWNAYTATTANTATNLSGGTVSATTVTSSGTVSGATATGTGPSSAVVGVASSSGNGVNGSSSSGNGVNGSSSSGNGVNGSSSSGNGVNGSSSISYGVYGTSSSASGVYGTSTSNNGVYGGSGTGVGVYGISSSYIGVQGNSTSNYGVYGNSSTSVGVYGNSTSSNGVYGISSSAAGVSGSSTSGYGVYGYSSSGVGVVGISSTGPALAVAPQSSAPTTNLVNGTISIGATTGTINIYFGGAWYHLAIGAAGWAN